MSRISTLLLQVMASMLEQKLINGETNQLRHSNKRLLNSSRNNKELLLSNKLIKHKDREIKRKNNKRRMRRKRENMRKKRQKRIRRKRFTKRCVIQHLLYLIPSIHLQLKNVMLKMLLSY